MVNRSSKKKTKKDGIERDSAVSKDRGPYNKNNNQR
jgi:hypothetical protein